MGIKTKAVGSDRMHFFDCFFVCYIRWDSWIQAPALGVRWLGSVSWMAALKVRALYVWSTPSTPQREELRLSPDCMEQCLGWGLWQGRVYTCWCGYFLSPQYVRVTQLVPVFLTHVSLVYLYEEGNSEVSYVIFLVTPLVLGFQHMNLGKT